MTTSTKTPVQIIQELIAVHSTRKEVAEKMMAKEPGGDMKERLLPAQKQSDEFIAALMSELSNYGDGVSPMAERDNEYQRAWKDALGKVDAASQEELQEIFMDLENKLKKFYEEVLASQADLPLPIEEMIKKQSSTL